MAGSASAAPAAATQAHGRPVALHRLELTRHDAGQVQAGHAGNERRMKDAAGAAVADQGDLQGRMLMRVLS